MLGINLTPVVNNFVQSWIRGNWNPIDSGFNPQPCHNDYLGRFTHAALVLFSLPVAAMGGVEEGTPGNKESAGWSQGDYLTGDRVGALMPIYTPMGAPAWPADGRCPGWPGAIRRNCPLRANQI